MVPFETLVLRAQSGILPLEQRQDAFAELVHRFQSFISQQAQQTLSDPQMVPDIVQETFLSAWLHLESLQHPRAFPSWLKRILHTQCNRITRRAPINKVCIDDFELAGNNTQRPDHQFDARDLRNQVRDAIDHLPEHERIVVYLFYIKGYSQREISTRTGLPIKTIKSRLYSARQRLLDWLEPVLDEHLEAQPSATVLSAIPRPEQATNMLSSTLETLRLEAQMPLLVQSPTDDPVLISVPQTSGAMVSTPQTQF